MSAREEILDRIRNALKDNPVVPEIPRLYRSTSGMDEAALIEQLVDRLLDYKASVVIVEPQHISTKINELLKDATSFVIPEGLDPDWIAFDQNSSRARIDSTANSLNITELDSVDAVVTASAVSIAETGTIILDASANQGRRAITLIPDHHICVVKVSDIVGIVPEALKRIEGTRPLTMISGPSATSDIELQRVEGVHGPRTLDVIISR